MEIGTNRDTICSQGFAEQEMPRNLFGNFACMYNADVRDWLENVSTTVCQSSSDKETVPQYWQRTQ